MSKANWQIVWRCLVEFGPPLLVGFIWWRVNYDPKKDYVDWISSFSAAFFASGIGWWNFLRIQYQTNTRNQMKEAVVGISSLIETFGRVETVLDDLKITLTSLKPSQAKEEEKIEVAVGNANTAIDNANTALRDAKTKLRFYLDENLIKILKGTPTANS